MASWGPAVSKSGRLATLGHAHVVCAQYEGAPVKYEDPEEEIEGGSFGPPSAHRVSLRRRSLTGPSRGPSPRAIRSVTSSNKLTVTTRSGGRLR